MMKEKKIRNPLGCFLQLRAQDSGAAPDKTGSMYLKSLPTAVFAQKLEQFTLIHWDLLEISFLFFNNIILEFLALGLLQKSQSKKMLEKVFLNLLYKLQYYKIIIKMGFQGITLCTCEWVNSTTSMCMGEWGGGGEGRVGAEDL